MKDLIATKIFIANSNEEDLQSLMDMEPKLFVEKFEKIIKAKVGERMNSNNYKFRSCQFKILKQ